MVRYQAVESRNAQNKIVEIYGVVEPVTMRAVSEKLGLGIYIRFPQNRGTLTIRNTDHTGQAAQTRTNRVTNAADIAVYSDVRDSISFVKPKAADLPGICGYYRRVYRYTYSYLALVDHCFEMYGHRGIF